MISASALTGLARCAWNPAASASARSCTREKAVSAMAGSRCGVEAGGAHIAQQLVAVELRHADVAHQQVRSRRLDVRHGRFGAGRVAHLRAGVGQDARDQRARIGIVLDHQDANLAQPRGLIASGSRWGACSVSGRRTRNVAPLPTPSLATLDGAVMDVHQVFDDGEADARARRSSCRCRIPAG